MVPPGTNDPVAGTRTTVELANVIISGARLLLNPPPRFAFGATLFTKPETTKATMIPRAIIDDCMSVFFIIVSLLELGRIAL